MPVVREVRCTACGGEGRAVENCQDPQAPANCQLAALSPRYVIGDNVTARHSPHPWTVESIELSKGAIGAHRYQLSRIVDMLGPGGTARRERTSAYAADMTLIPAAVPAPELALIPDPPAANSPAQELAADSPAPDSPADERSAAELIRSDRERITLNEDPDIVEFREAMAQIDVEVEVDHSDDPDDPDDPRHWKIPRSSVRELRYYPAVAMSYSQLKNIIYSSKFRGMENGPYEELDNDTPVAVAVTRETNGAAVWVITTRDRDEVRDARLELFYPADRIPHDPSSETMAIEHGVLLALRKIPIRTNDLEILLLQIEP